MRRVLAVVLCALVTVSLHGQTGFGVLGRSLARATSITDPPCDLVSGCVAAYSAQRRMLSTYTGKLFQLKRSSDGFASTQDIGLTGSAVDYATITTYCGSTSSSGRNTTTTNGCKFWKIYDQSGNGNDLTSVDAAYAQCLTPYAVDASGHPIFLNGPASDHCHFGNRFPTNAPAAGNPNISLYVAGDDALWGSIEGSPFGYSMDFGMMHNFDPSTCCPNGTDFDIVIRTSGQLVPAPNTCGSFLSLFPRKIIDDLELNVVEKPYAIADHDATEAALSTNLETLSSVGKFVAATSYNNSSSDILFEFNYGLASAQTYTINWNATNTTSMTGLALGSGQNPEIRQGYTGDTTGATPSAWYEGAIYASTLTQTQLRTLNTSGETFYSMASPTPCSNGGLDLLGGVSSVTGAWGIRQLDPTKTTGTIVIARADNGALKALGTASGTCSPDVSGVASFCSGTTCHVYDLPNQALSVAARNGGWNGTYPDNTRVTSGGSASTGPTFTLNGLNTTLPVITCGGADVLTSIGSANAVTRPFTLAASAKRTTTGGSLFQDGSATDKFHDSTSANLLQVHSSSGTQTATAADGTWFAAAGTVVGGVIKAYVNGTPSTSGTVTTGDASSTTWKVCNGWTGALTELYLLNGTDAGATALGNLSTVQRSIGGF